MFCKNCGQAIADDAAFCPNCNTPVASAEPAQPQTPPVDAPYAQQPVAPQQPYAQQPVPPQQPYGQPTYTDPYAQQQPYTAGNPYQPVPPKPSIAWLIVNIVCVVLCGFTNVIGIIGIIFCALAQSAYGKGAYADAESKAKTGKILGIITLIGTVALYVLYIFSLALGVSLLGSGYYY